MIWDLAQEETGTPMSNPHSLLMDILKKCSWHRSQVRDIIENVIFYYFKRVIHSLIHQSNRELEAANGQLLRRASCCISTLLSACCPQRPHEGWDSGVELAVTIAWTDDQTQRPTDRKGLDARGSRGTTCQHPAALALPPAIHTAPA